MLRTAALRRSIQSKEDDKGIHWTSSQPYASLHNEGGEITVTPKMKKYFWAKYYEAGQSGPEAEQFKALALKKVGDKMEVEQRQFIGDHPEVRRMVEECFKAAIPEMEDYIMKLLKQR